MNKEMAVNEKKYRIIKLLGKGKGGYSYLADDGISRYVLKQIHHEPCDYYQFGNKLEAEIRDYKRLKTVGIKMPAMLEADVENERILKEFIDGDTIYELILQDKMKSVYIEQLHRMCALLYVAHMNIDYFPTNFVVHNGEIYYVDFECNDYMCVGVTNLINIFQPEVFCVGGGISRQGERLIKPLREYNETHGYFRGHTPQTRIVAAKLFGDAGIIGAALLGRTAQ